MSKGLIIFDIDGTLFRADLVSCEAYAQVLPEFALPAPTREQVLGMLGDDPETVARKLGVSGELAVKLAARIDAAEAERIPLGRLYDGVEAMLDALLAADYKLALCSMGVRTYVEGVANAHGLARRCAHMRWARPGVSKGRLMAEIIAEAGSPAFAVMVGDRAYDTQAARECGISCVAVTYGFSPHEVAGEPLRVDTVDGILLEIEQLYAAHI